MTLTLWTLVTQLGNALWLLPAAAVLAAWLWLGGARRMAWGWAACFGLAVLLVLASKIAFLGFGIGIRSLDFTGISGHATVATAVFTMLLYVWPRSRAAWVPRLAVAAGMAIGLAVGVSRLVLRAHSLSEVLAGCALGAVAALAAIAVGRRLRGPLPHRWVPSLLLVALFLLPHLPLPLQSHDIVSRLSLLASGRGELFSRHSSAW
jgi:membrane-associated phospholipid phosphatase